MRTTFSAVTVNFKLSVQSEKSKRAGNAASTTTLIDFLRSSYSGFSDILLLEEDMNFNLRAASLAVSYSQFPMAETNDISYK